MFSTYADVCEALVPLLAADEVLGEVEVCDTVTPGNSTKTEALIINFATEDAPELAEGDFNYEGYRGVRGREAYAVHSAIKILSGSVAQAKAQRARAFHILGRVARVLNSGGSLGGLLLTSRVGTWAVSYSETPRGAYLVLVFDINCVGYTASVN